MPQAIKRHQDIYLSSNAILRKTFLKNKKLKNSIENLSNEIFYEIFDYLDGCDIYMSFSNLNIRFQNLLISPLLHLKIEFSTESESLLEYHYKSFISSNKHRILSLHFYDQLLLNKFFTLCSFNSLFINLQSLVFHEISPFKFVVILYYLKCLPCLYSLTVCLDYCYDDLGDIYQIIFQLSSLKYLKMDISQIDDDLIITLPYAIEEQYTSIQRLSICHYCNIKELTIILSYTPQISHLYCIGLSYSNNKIDETVLMKLKNLIHLNIDICDLDFDQFKEFIIKFSFHLQKLIFSTDCLDKHYLDGDRWKQLIVEYMPCLNIFDFCYNDDIIDDFEITSQYSLINRFNSSFWIKHQWVFSFRIETDQLVYRIRPYTEDLNNFQEYQNSLIDENPGVHMSIANIGKSKYRPIESYEIFINKISPLFQMVDVTHLFIECYQMNYDVLIQILNFLPNIDLLKIRLSLNDQEFFLNNQDNKNLYQFLDNNKINKLIVENLSQYQDIFFLIYLFPRIKYLTIQITDNLHLESFVKYIIEKINENHHQSITLCIIAYQQTFDQLEKLHRMIHSNNLLKNYTIDRRFEKFYIQWK